MFSVIIPVYNKALYIQKAILSVLNQTYHGFELLIVNDGSTDNSLETIKLIDFSGCDVQMISQPNMGVSVARNNGVKLAKYNYIAFLDADDWWDKDFLKEMKKLIGKYPDAGIYGSSYFYVKNRKQFRLDTGIESNFEDGYIDYFKAYSKTLKMTLWTGAVILPKHIFKQENGFKSQLKLGEDFDLWVRIALKNKVAYLSKPLAYYNQDIELKNRAIGNKLYKKEEHFIFNLEYLAEEEKNNHSFKQLIDALRIYTLFPYFLSKNGKSDAETELKKVDWTKQASKEYIRYHQTPVWKLKMTRISLRLVSAVKQFILKRFRI